MAKKKNENEYTRFKNLQQFLAKAGHRNTVSYIDDYIVYKTDIKDDMVKISCEDIPRDLYYLFYEAKCVDAIDGLVAYEMSYKDFCIMIDTLIKEKRIKYKHEKSVYY